MGYKGEEDTSGEEEMGPNQMQKVVEVVGVVGVVGVAVFIVFVVSVVSCVACFGIFKTLLLSPAQVVVGITELPSVKQCTLRWWLGRKAGGSLRRFESGVKTRMNTGHAERRVR